MPTRSGIFIHLESPTAHSSGEHSLFTRSTPARYKVLGFLDLELQAEKSEKEVY